MSFTFYKMSLENLKIMQKIHTFNPHFSIEKKKAQMPFLLYGLFFWSLLLPTLCAFPKWKGLVDFISGTEQNIEPFSSNAIKKDIKEGLLIPSMWLLLKTMRKNTFDPQGKDAFALIGIVVLGSIASGMISRWVYKKTRSQNKRLATYYMLYTLLNVGCILAWSYFNDKANFPDNRMDIFIDALFAHTLLLVGEKVLEERR